MDYNRCDELIMMWVLAALREVTPGRGDTDLCRPTILIKLGEVTREVKRGPAVIRWSPCSRCTLSTASIAGQLLIYSFIKMAGNSFKLDLIYINKHKSYNIRGFFYGEGQRSSFIFRANARPPESLSLELLKVCNKYGVHDRKWAKSRNPNSLV